MDSIHRYTTLGDWNEKGYVVVRGLFDAGQTERLREIAESVLTQWRLRNPENGEPGQPDTTVMRHLNHPGYFAEDPEAKTTLLEAIAAAKPLAVCRYILGEEPLFRCTSLFMQPLLNSREGSWHRDSQFHCPDLEDERQMVAGGGEAGHAVQLQVALVPSDDVEVVPASHNRWDTPEEFAIRRADGGKNSTSSAMPGALRVALDAGDAVAFNPLGLHRGRYHVDKERRTLMLTYTKSSVPRFDYFSNQPWFSNANYLEGVGVDAQRFFSRFVTEYEAEWEKEQ